MVNLAGFHTGVRKAEEVWDTACGRGLGYCLRKRSEILLAEEGGITRAMVQRSSGMQRSEVRYSGSCGAAEIRDAAFGSEVFGKLWCSEDRAYSRTIPVSPRHAPPILIAVPTKSTGGGQLTHTVPSTTHHFHEQATTVLSLR